MFRGAPVDRGRRLHPFLDRATRWPRPRRGILPAASIWCWSRSRPTALGPALKWEPSRGGALFPHLYGALPLDAVLWVKPLPLGADGRHVFPEVDAVIGLFEALARPLLRLLDAGGRAPAGHPGTESSRRIVTRARRRPAAGGARLRAQLPQPGRHGGRLRQARRGARRAAAARLRLRRDRHRDAAAADRQSAAARCSGCRPTRA